METLGEFFLCFSTGTLGFELLKKTRSYKALGYLRLMIVQTVERETYLSSGSYYPALLGLTEAQKPTRPLCGPPGQESPSFPPVSCL